jgi:hypothetical protein
LAKAHLPQHHCRERQKRYSDLSDTQFPTGIGLYRFGQVRQQARDEHMRRDDNRDTCRDEREACRHCQPLHAQGSAPAIRRTVSVRTVSNVVDLQQRDNWSIPRDVRPIRAWQLPGFGVIGPWGHASRCLALLKPLQQVVDVVERRQTM